MDTRQRLYSRVQMTSQCWEWQGARSSGRWDYGVMSVDGRQELTHRIAWSLENGPIPAGMWVLHHCDNPPCVRPDHLFLGTVTDNVRDMVAKGRHVYSLDHSLRDACRRGHPLSGTNLGFCRGKRICKECDRLRHRVRRAS